MKGVRARIIADIKTHFTGMKQSDSLFASLLILQSLNPKVNVAFILFVLYFLLLVGNIESNPGPESAYISSTPLSAVDILSDKY
jgi:hypothetical protein